MSAPLLTHITVSLFYYIHTRMDLRKTNNNFFQAVKFSAHAHTHTQITLNIGKISLKIIFLRENRRKSLRISVQYPQKDVRRLDLYEPEAVCHKITKCDEGKNKNAVYPNKKIQENQNKQNYISRHRCSDSVQTFESMMQ